MNSEFSTKLESKFLDKKQMKEVALKIKHLSKTKIEAVSVWRALDGDNGELRSNGFVIFRKVLPKDKMIGRKLIAVLKFKCRLADDAEELPRYFLGDEELSHNEAKDKGYDQILELLE